MQSRGDGGARGGRKVTWGTHGCKGIRDVYMGGMHTYRHMYGACMHYCMLMRAPKDSIQRSKHTPEGVLISIMYTYILSG